MKSTPAKNILRHVVLVGLGNIGSQAAELIARMGIPHITLVDAGSYEKKNLATQAIGPDAVGKPKAMAMAKKLRRIDRRIGVVPLHARIQDVPLGLLRGADVIASGLDNRLARAYVNQTSRQLGIPWLIDAGVEASQLLARVNVHRSGPDDSCLQCGWSPADYDLLEVRNPCQAGEDVTPSTNSPASLGALAASLLATELQKIADGKLDLVMTGRQITHCALTHRLFTTSIGLNPDCLCDHQPWTIKPLKQSAGRLPLRAALRHGQRDGHLSVPGKIFVRALVCPRCNATKKLLRLEGRLTPRQLACSKCGTAMLAPGFDQLDRIDRLTLGDNSRWLNQPVARLGLHNGDIVCFSSGQAQRYVELGQ